MEIYEDICIPGLKVIVPRTFKDDRGWFQEDYSEQRYANYGIRAKFVQDNTSMSMKGVFRGLHWQAAPYTQAKLVRVIQGSVADIALDIRANSPTFGKWNCVILTGENKKQFYIPRGFAHGFICLEDNTIFSYKCDNFYNKESERGLSPLDPELKLNLPSYIILSEKDKKHPLLKDIEPYEEGV